MPSDTLDSYPVPELFRAAPDSGRFDVHGTLVGVRKCPPCPPYAACMPCMGEYITLAFDSSAVPLPSLEWSPRQITIGVEFIRQIEGEQAYEVLRDVEQSRRSRPRLARLEVGEVYDVSVEVRPCEGCFSPEVGPLSHHNVFLRAVSSA